MVHNSHNSVQRDTPGQVDCKEILHQQVFLDK